MKKILKRMLWWALALIALALIPVVHLAFNLSGDRTTYLWIFREWLRHVKSREPWGPFA